MTAPDVFELGATLARALDDAGIANALGGAIALAAWGIPRATVDVDLNVFVDDAALEGVFDVLEAALGVSVDRDAARQAHKRAGLIVLHSRDGVRIDLFTPSIEFSWEASKTASRRQVLGREVSVLSAEALAVFKLLFFRGKDIVDLERLVATQGDRLDHSYVRRWMVEMVGEQDERVVKWDELVRLFG